MAYQIGSDCIACGVCESQCPVGCISMGDEHFVIDEDACISCGTCADACPMSAISQK